MEDPCPKGEDQVDSKEDKAKEVQIPSHHFINIYIYIVFKCFQKGIIRV